MSNDEFFQTIFTLANSVLDCDYPLPKYLKDVILKSLGLEDYIDHQFKNILRKVFNHVEERKEVQFCKRYFSQHHQFA